MGKWIKYLRDDRWSMSAPGYSTSDESHSQIEVLSLPALELPPDLGLDLVGLLNQDI